MRLIFIYLILLLQQFISFIEGLTKLTALDESFKFHRFTSKG